jgi:RHS repeat-associated protein
MVSYTRGTDLSGSLEGAGGIGGLLARSHGYSGGNWSTHNFYHADGNGNITYLVNSSQTIAASYRYDPFGNLISSSGSLATANVYRFSSKELHVNSGMYYYGYRFYEPSLQRWISQDPIGEWDGVNLYTFVRNRPIDEVDVDGRKLNVPAGQRDENWVLECIHYCLCTICKRAPCPSCCGVCCSDKCYAYQLPDPGCITKTRPPGPKPKTTPKGGSTSNL